MWKMKKLSNWVKDHPILSTLITSALFLLVFQPFLMPLSNAVPLVANSALSRVSDWIYIIAARASPHRLILLIGNILFGSSLGVLFANFLPRFPIKASASDIVLKSNSASGINPENIEMPTEEIAAKLDNILKSVDHIEDDINKELEKRKRGAVAICVFLMLSFVLTSAFFAFPQVLRISFDSNIDLIAPYTSDGVIKGLRSKWVRMTSYDDYKEICIVIDGIKAAEGL
jgi:hypothetical protein